jgi:hypothetical protein
VPSGFQVSLASTVECDAAPKPACAAQVLCRFVGPAGPTGAAPESGPRLEAGGEQR